jgi:glucose dehydrogenase
MTKVFSKISIKAFSISLLFFVSSIGTSVMVSAAGASPNSPAALAAAPLTQLQANWAFPNGNPFNQDYNPQNVINSTNAQFLSLSWLFPLPTPPSALVSVSGGLGVDSAPLIVNGTIYFVTQSIQVFAVNAANGNVLWTTVLPIRPNSTAGHGTGAISLHLHDGNEQFTTKLFGNTPAFWVSAPDQKVYAINALTGKYLLNFSDFDGINTVAGNNPGALYTGTATNLMVDEQRGIVITSILSGSSAATGRCFFRGWNILVTPPKLMWTAFCTPPQPGSNMPVDPNWEISIVNGMKGAQIFYPGPAYNAGGPIPGTAVVDLKKLSPAVLNSTLYNDWGYVNQSPACAAATGGGSTGSTAAGWGSPWLLGTGPTAGLAFVNTNNKDPYNSACTAGPNLWSAAIMALNETNGQWVWGFQSAAHEAWDYDCSWWQAMGNETVNGASTQVIWKTCKSGYLYELNAQTGTMIWAWTPPLSIVARCQYCYMYNPLNSTQMNYAFFNPSLQPTLCTPCTFGFESEGAYSPTTNYIYVVSQNQPRMAYYVAMNSTNYKTTPGTAYFPPPGAPAGSRNQGPWNNATVEAVNAATGQMVWSYYIPLQGYRGGNTVSGNVVYITLSSGDMLMLNALTGTLIKDLFIGGPLNNLPAIGATANGLMEVIFPITAGALSWGTAVPGDIVALTLQNLPAETTNTVTATAAGQTVTTTVGGGATTVTSISTVRGGGATVTVTSTAPGAATSTGVDTTTLYGVAAVAVIFIIATGYLATRGRKPAS